MNTIIKLHDRIYITELETKGRVVGIYVSQTGTQYQVRYFYNGDAKTVYFYQDEITLRDV